MFRKVVFIFVVMLIFSSLSACQSNEEFKQLSDKPESGEEIAIITTNHGVIKARFFPEYAPKAVENFIEHAKAGYYNGVIFHRVIDEFMIQGGDPTGTGTGGESIWGDPFGVEVTPNLHHIRGALSMAKTQDPISIGSQFFIVQNTELHEVLKSELNDMLSNPKASISMYGNGYVYGSSVYKDDNGKDLTVEMQFPKPFIERYLESGGTPHLDYAHTVFGQVFEGMEVVDAIAILQTDSNDRPLEDVIIESIVIEIY